VILEKDVVGLIYCEITEPPIRAIAHTRGEVKINLMQMVFKIILSMMGITTTLLLMNDVRNRAKIRRLWKQLKTITNGKESEKRKSKETEKGIDAD
jgi:signal transduction histidine kinase